MITLFAEFIYENWIFENAHKEIHYNLKKAVLANLYTNFDGIIISKKNFRAIFLKHLWVSSVWKSATYYYRKITKKATRYCIRWIKRIILLNNKYFDHKILLIRVVKKDNNKPKNWKGCWKIASGFSPEMMAPLKLLHIFSKIYFFKWKLFLVCIFKDSVFIDKFRNQCCHSNTRTGQFRRNRVDISMLLHFHFTSRNVLMTFRYTFWHWPYIEECYRRFWVYDWNGANYSTNVDNLRPETWTLCIYIRFHSVKYEA